MPSELYGIVHFGTPTFFWQNTPRILKSVTICLKLETPVKIWTEWSTRLTREHSTRANVVFSQLKTLPLKKIHEKQKQKPSLSVSLLLLVVKKTWTHTDGIQNPSDYNSLPS